MSLAHVKYLYILIPTFSENFRKMLSVFSLCFCYKLVFFWDLYLIMHPSTPVRTPLIKMYLRPRGLLLFFSPPCVCGLIWGVPPRPASSCLHSPILPSFLVGVTFSIWNSRSCRRAALKFLTWLIVLKRPLKIFTFAPVNFSFLSVLWKVFHDPRSRDMSPGPFERVIN